MEPILLTVEEQDARLKEANRPLDAQLVVKSERVAVLEKLVAQGENINCELEETLLRLRAEIAG